MTVPFLWACLSNYYYLTTATIRKTIEVVLGGFFDTSQRVRTKTDLLASELGNALLWSKIIVNSTQSSVYSKRRLISIRIAFLMTLYPPMTSHSHSKAGN